MESHALPQAQVDSMHFWKMFSSLASSTNATKDEAKAPPSTPLPMQDIDIPIKQEDDKETQGISEVSFRGEQIFISHPVQARLLFLKRRFTFVYVRDLDLRSEIARITSFDEECWEYEPGTHIYRLGDMAYLLHRLSRDPELQPNEHLDDLEQLFNVLSEELDRMNTLELQIELSLSRDIVGPGEWLQYFYWCHIVNHMQPLKGCVVRADQFGRISAMGEPKAAKILGARQVNGGVLVCCSWRWGSDTIFIADIQHLNTYGLFFTDYRIQSSALLRGWASQMLNAPTRVGDVYWGLTQADTGNEMT